VTSALAHLSINIIKQNRDLVDHVFRNFQPEKRRQEREA